MWGDKPTLTEGDLLYLAGLFDGEGSAGVWGGGTKRNKSPIPKVAVSMTDPDPIYFFALCLGGNVYKRFYTTGSHAGHKLVYIWTRPSRGALAAALTLIPYVKNKSKIAQLNSIIEHYRKMDNDR